MASVPDLFEAAISLRVPDMCQTMFLPYTQKVTGSIPVSLTI